MDEQKLSASAGRLSSEELGPCGTLHADGYFTWARRDGYVLDAQLPAKFVLAEMAHSAIARVEEQVNQFAKDERADEADRWRPRVEALTAQLRDMEARHWSLVKSVADGVATMPPSPVLVLAQPLTAQQLDKLIEAHVGGAELADGEYSAMVMFAAAVERAHGIGPNVAIKPRRQASA